MLPLVFGLALVLGAAGGSANKRKQPNVLLIVADDQGHAQVGYHNASTLTPRIDALAAGGITLENYYVQPVCSPTRSVLMTGRYTNRLGTQATVIRADVPFGVPLDNTFLPQNLQDAGYVTALFGKWHLGFYQRAYTPLARGFDEHLGYFEGEVDYVTHVGGGYAGTRKGVDWHRGNGTTCFEDGGTWTEDLIVAESLSFLHRMAAAQQQAAPKAAKPFFLYYPLHLIHGPNEAPQRFLDLFPERNLSATAASYGMCGVCQCKDQRSGDFAPSDVSWGACRTVLAMTAALDWAVGEVVDGLKDSGLYDDTIIIYTSDNGAQPGQGGTNAPLRGWKTQLYEGGVRVPGFVHSPLLPAAVQGTVHHGLFHASDWLPTIARGIAGGDTSRNLPLDGYDIWPALTGGPDTPSPRNELLHNINAACHLGYVFPNAGLRVGDMKLLVDCFNYTTMAPTGLVELYNISADPYELTNMAADPDMAGTVASMVAKLKAYAAQADQVPPTLFPEKAPKHAQPGIKPGYYQCPQCSQGNAVCDHAGGRGALGCRLDPWCDDVVCSEDEP